MLCILMIKFSCMLMAMELAKGILPKLYLLGLQHWAYIGESLEYATCPRFGVMDYDLTLRERASLENVLLQFL